MHARAIVPYLVVAVGVMAVASSSILIRFAQQLNLNALTIAAGRLGIAALILLPLTLIFCRRDLRELTRRQIILGSIAGIFLAIHFAAWISSLEYTSVASSVALVNTNPLWVALATVFVFRKRLAPLTIFGVGLTVGGSILIAISDSSGGTGANPLFGDLLAVVGALAVSVYFLIGLELRKTMRLLPYIWLVYSIAAVLLMIAAVQSRLATGLSLVSVFTLPPLAWLLLAGLAIGPQLIGHTSFNWALRYMSATFVAVSILGEPVGSALFALFLFHEQFQPQQLVGFAILLGGILVSAFAERQPTQTIAPEGSEVIANAP